MEFLSNVSFNENTLDSAKLQNAVIGSHPKAGVPGSIKYDGGVLKYWDGSLNPGAWVTLGASGSVSEIAGKYTIDTDLSEINEQAVVNVQAEGIENGLRIIGNGKGNISFSGEGHGNTPVSTDVVKILYTNIDVPATNNGIGLSYIFTHNLNTRNILVNTYFAKKDKTDPSVHENYTACQCDLEIYSPNEIYITLTGNIPAGWLKIVVYGGAETMITGTAATVGGPVINSRTPSSVGTYVNTSVDTTPITPSGRI